MREAFESTKRIDEFLKKKKKIFGYVQSILCVESTHFGL